MYENRPHAARKNKQSLAAEKRTAATGGTGIPTDWREAFAPLAEAVPQQHTPVALGFELVVHFLKADRH
ncbi:hypothetical protein ACH82I_09395 [Brevibacterium sp. GP-SGM9]|uniref:hypothetical protein n=1 Tax=Brevibacterium sp. GP-SGM9 TaxID=3376990 RepID=UPI0039A5A8B0